MVSLLLITWLMSLAGQALGQGIPERGAGMSPPSPTIDETIPWASGRRLFEAAPGRKDWVTIEEADHNDWITEDYLRQLDRFLESLP